MDQLIGSYIRNNCTSPENSCLGRKEFPFTKSVAFIVFNKICAFMSPQDILLLELEEAGRKGS